MRAPPAASNEDDQRFARNLLAVGKEWFARLQLVIQLVGRLFDPAAYDRIRGVISSDSLAQLVLSYAELKREYAIPWLEPEQIYALARHSYEGGNIPRVSLPNGRLAVPPPIINPEFAHIMAFGDTAWFTQAKKRGH